MLHFIILLSQAIPCQKHKYRDSQMSKKGKYLNGEIRTENGFLKIIIVFQSKRELILWRSTGQPMTKLV